MFELEYYIYIYTPQQLLPGKHLGAELFWSLLLWQRVKNVWRDLWLLEEYFTFCTKTLNGNIQSDFS